MISTAYATEENGYRIIVYVIDFYGGLVAFSDAVGQQEAEIKKITDGYYPYNSNSVIGDIQRNLCVYNGYDHEGGNRITIFENGEGKDTAADLDKAIQRLPVPPAYQNHKQVEYTKLRYEALSQQEKQKVIQAKTLMDLVVQMNEVVHDTIDSIIQRIAAISDPITMKDQTMLEALWNDYGQLSDEHREQVPNARKLKQAMKELYACTASLASLIEQIEALQLDTITAADLNYLKQLQAVYQKLSPADQANVSNYAKLQKAMYQAQVSYDLTQVPALIQEIASLPEKHQITLDEEANIQAIMNRYATLMKEAQNAVVNADKLLELNELLIQQRQMVESLNQDNWEQLDPRNITLNDEITVEALLHRYAALSKQNQAYVKYYEDVIQAQQIIASLHQGIIPDIVFEQIQGSDFTYRYDGVWNGIEYQIAINGMDIETIMDMDVSLYADSYKDEVIRQQYPKAKILRTGQAGDYPGTITLTFTQIKQDGVYHCYKLEEGTIVSAGTITVQDGIAIAKLKQGGIYIIDPAADSSDFASALTYDQTALSSYRFGFYISLILLAYLIKQARGRKQHYDEIHN